MRYKSTKRLFHIGLNTINNLLNPAINILMSIVIIRFCSKELWGQVVGIMLWVGIITHIASFGNKDFLLREFSLSPFQSAIKWKESLSSRFLIILCSIPFFLLLHLSLNIFLCVVILAFFRFIYQSYDPIIIYKNWFHLSIILELISFISIVSLILFFDCKISFSGLILLYTIIESLKTITLGLLLRNDFSPSFKSKPMLSYFRLSFPFFILNFTGMLASKIDLVCVNHFLSKSDVASYQVLINFLLIIQASSNFILIPFVKNLYRLKKQIILKLSFKLFLIGILITSIGIVLLKFFLRQIYHIDLDLSTMFIGGLFTLPIFYYSPIIYLLFKMNRQNLVIGINLSAILFSFLLCVFLIPSYQIFGAILSIAITQWLVLLTYLYFQWATPTKVFAS